MIIGSHLILHGYGHWFPNDPRGSGSSDVREEKLRALGEIHFGRKRVQPPREELRQFWREGEKLLKLELLWFDDTSRTIITNAFAALIASIGYTVWACAILKNHAHVVVRRHRDDPETMWGRFADASRAALRDARVAPIDHHVWSLRPYKVYLDTPDDVIRAIDYAKKNPEKEGLRRRRSISCNPIPDGSHRESSSQSAAGVDRTVRFVACDFASFPHNFDMPTLISSPTRVQAAGNKPKLIDEFIGRVNSKESRLSIAHMRSPGGWAEPGQTPEFEEFTIVLAGMLRVEHKDGQIDVRPGQAIIAHAGEWVRYSTPQEAGAEYLAICLPAFSPQTVHRDSQ